MSTEPSRTIGKIDCAICGEEMPVRQNGRDTLNLSCPWCGHSSYAKGGTEAHRIVSGWMRKGAAPDDEKPAPSAPVAVPVAPTLATLAKAINPAFDMGLL